MASNSKKVLVLLILFQAFGASAVFAHGTEPGNGGMSIPLVIVVGAVAITLAALLFLVWLILSRLGRQLQVANISLLQSEMKEVSYRHRINEAAERYQRLEQQLRETQYELHKAREQR